MMQRLFSANSLGPVRQTLASHEHHIRVHWLECSWRVFLFNTKQKTQKHILIAAMLEQTMRGPGCVNYVLTCFDHGFEAPWIEFLDVTYLSNNNTIMSFWQEQASVLGGSFEPRLDGVHCTPAKSIEKPENHDFLDELLMDTACW